MDDPQFQLRTDQELSIPAQQLSYHLLYHPYDLIDVRRLLRRFQASVADFQQAVWQVEHYGVHGIRRTACPSQ